MKRKDFIILFWVSLATTLVFFFLSTEEKNLENFSLTLFISAMYSFLIGTGNGLINSFLNKKSSVV